MKKLLLLLLTPYLAFGLQSYKVNAATSNIPTSFDTSAGSLISIASEAGAVTSHVQVLNTTTEPLAISIVDNNNTTVPTTAVTTNLKQVYIPAAGTGSTSGAVLDGFGRGKGGKIYIRSDGSAATTGIVRVTIW